MHKSHHSSANDNLKEKSDRRLNIVADYGATIHVQLHVLPVSLNSLYFIELNQRGYL